MDAHYDMVMKARAAAKHDPARLYFAYSTVLDRPAFLEWRGQHGYDTFDLPAGVVAEAVDVALVYDFPSRWWGGRVAGLADRPGARVWGRVFEIAGVDWPIVQHKEGAITGMTTEKPVRVRIAGSAGTPEMVDAFAFATRPERTNTTGAISPRFVAALVSGAKSAGLPAEWVARLERGESE